MKNDGTNPSSEITKRQQRFEKALKFATAVLFVTAKNCELCLPPCFPPLWAKLLLYSQISSAKKEREAVKVRTKRRRPSPF